MKVEDGIKLDYSDVLIRPKRSTLTSRNEVDLNRHFVFRNVLPDLGPNEGSTGVMYAGTPVMAANMDGVGTFHMAKELSSHGMMTIITKQHTIDEWVENAAWVEKNQDRVAISIGTGAEDYKKLQTIIIGMVINIKYICIDVANGYSEHFVEHCKRVREDFPHNVIIAGNVVTREMTEELILNGVDIVKVGIGPGSVCTTRVKTGVGYPQLSAVAECADAAHGLGGHIIADGGCTCAGDVAKAFGAGADFVMLGGMLAGHKEGGSVWTNADGYERCLEDVIQEDPDGWEDSFNPEELFVRFYGMSSDTAQEKHSGGLKSYRASEGKTVDIPYKGPVINTVQDILGGIRSACTYCGAKSLKQMPKCTTFIRVNNTHNRVFG